MGKALLLYLLVLASMGIAVWQPTLAWLAMVMFFLGLPIGAIWLWRSEGRSIRDLGLRRAKPWVRDFGNGFLIGLILPMVLTLFLAITGSLTLVPTTWPVSLLVGILGGVIRHNLTKQCLSVAKIVPNRPEMAGFRTWGQSKRPICPKIRVALARLTLNHRKTDP